MHGERGKWASMDAAMKWTALITQSLQRERENHNFGSTQGG